MKLDERKRQQNQRKFGTWENLAGGGRLYRYEVKGRHGWRAVYVKEVDRFEATVSFRQEIYNRNGELMEVHKKYPADRGHERVSGKGERS